MDGMCYTSQLNVTVTADMIGKSIECYYDSNTATLHSVGATSIITGKSNKSLAVICM
jgi:hypothetical protein